MVEEQLVEQLTNSLRGLQQGIEAKMPRRVYVDIPRESLLDVAKILKDDFDGYHISTITAIDAGENFELLYHIIVGAACVTLRTKVPRNNPTIETLTPVLPGAVLFEREAHDIMGIIFKGHPDMRVLLLPDSWGNKGHPLRKDWVDPRKGGGQ